MKLFKLPALCFLMLIALPFIACENEIENNEVGSTQTLNAQKEVPMNSSTATGTIAYSYRKDIRVLSYTVTWDALTGPLALMHIHGTADPGFNAGVLQNIITPTNGIAAPSATRFPAKGSITASLFIDGQIFKEELLLAGKYYVNIHTAMYPGGEIRAQILFP